MESSNDGLFLSVAGHEVYHSAVSPLARIYKKHSIYSETMAYRFTYKTQFRYGLYNEAQNTMRTAISKGYWNLNSVPNIYKWFMF